MCKVWSEEDYNSIKWKQDITAVPAKELQDCQRSGSEKNVELYPKDHGESLTSTLGYFSVF